MCSSTALGQSALWTKRYPDYLPVSGAAEAPVGMAASSTGTYVAGTHYLTGTNSFFSLTRHDQIGGTAVQELMWPITGKKGIRTAKCAAMVPGGPPTGATMDCVIAGTTANPSGLPTTSVIMIHAMDSPSGPTMALGWATSDSALTDYDRVPVAVVADPNHAAVVSLAAYPGAGQPHIALLSAYDMAMGGPIVEGQFDTEGDDIANAVGLISTSDGSRAAVMLVTTPSDTNPGKTQLVLVGWTVWQGVGSVVPVGSQIAPLPLPQGTNESDAGVALATVSIDSVDPSVFFGCGTRTKAAGASAKDFITFKFHTERPNTPSLSDPDVFVLDWVVSYDNAHVSGENTDVAKAICVYERTPGENQTRGDTRIAVTGSSGAEPSSVATIVYDSGGSGVWYGNWSDHDEIRTGNLVPTAMSWARLYDESNTKERLYISAFAEKPVNGVPNRDYACVAYDTGPELPGPAVLKGRHWRNFYDTAPSNDDGRDEAHFIHTRNIGSQLITPALFMSGVSASSSTGDDWVTLSINP